ncbi:hypothetical protein SOCE26_079900 [Sorangium cellulosum]|uniref:Secreted protein n=1 Tax=Sorangium cellulosum TaxID=56 RepID=A0A2L0F4I8_SORCE|nr:hypothetical protein [Sorangium cellulosum]AUX46484.1 hypothetical protein SOCE26_079900 [Sorangium cellulosum]
MREETRRKALNAAARVALGMLACEVLAGCGGHYTTGERPPGLDGEEQRPPEVLTGGASTGGGADPYAAADGGGGTTSVGTAGSGPGEGGGGSLPEPAALACTGEVDLDHVQPRPRAELECCLSYTTERLPDPGLVPTDAQLAALSADASFVNCCAAVIEGVETDVITYDETGPVRSACCFGDIVAPEEELYARALCTPWGPPVPPALDAGDALEVA